MSKLKIAGLEVDSADGGTSGHKGKVSVDVRVCGLERKWFVMMMSVAVVMLVVAITVVIIVIGVPSGNVNDVQEEMEVLCSHWERNSLTQSDEKFELVGSVSHMEHEFAYEGVNAPEYWGCIKTEWKMCGVGQEQSPIDIATTGKAEDETIEKTPEEGNPSFVFMDEGVLMKTAADAAVFARGADDNHFVCVSGCNPVVNLFGDIPIKQIHFHAQSEHAFDGQLLPLEMHMVRGTNEYTIHAHTRARARQTSTPTR